MPPLKRRTRTGKTARASAKWNHQHYCQRKANQATKAEPPVTSGLPSSEIPSFFAPCVRAFSIGRYLAKGKFRSLSHSMNWTRARTVSVRAGHRPYSLLKSVASAIESVQSSPGQFFDGRSVHENGSFRFSLCGPSCSDLPAGRYSIARRRSCTRSARQPSWRMADAIVL